MIFGADGSNRMTREIDFDVVKKTFTKHQHDNMAWRQEMRMKKVKNKINLLLVY